MKGERKVCYVIDSEADATKRVAFVPHPNFRGIWIRTHSCVVFVSCRRCQSPAGIPCRSEAEKGPRAWVAYTHFVRRNDFADTKHEGIGTACGARTVCHSDFTVFPTAPLAVGVEPADDAVVR